jgi:hypothetical protein
MNVDTGKLCEYRQLLQSSMRPLWEEASCEEWARLAQGLPTHDIPVAEGTNTIFFIAHDKVPIGCIATYPRVVVADQPNQAKPIRVRVTVGGDRITYTDEVSTKTADLATAKILLNSTISTPAARWMTADIKDFYLNTPMTKVPISLFPPDIIAYYRLEHISHKGFVYCEIQKAGRLANNDLVDHLAKNGYLQSKTTPGLYQHTTRPITFCLVVDDFGIKYICKEHA